MVNLFGKKAFVKFCKNNKVLLLLFVFVNSVFIYQHSFGASWDFIAYVLNAKYMVGVGKYFELLRPPLTPLIIAMLSFGGFNLAEYLFIVFSTTMHFIASIKLADKLKFDRAFLYLLFITPTFFVYGLINGTELLSLSFYMLAFAYYETRGVFAALSFLTRYNDLILLPFIFLSKNWKSVLKNVAFFSLIVLPWIIYNYVAWHDPFASEANSYAINIKFRDYLHNSFSFTDVLIAGGILTPFAIFGAIRSFRKMDKMSWLMIAVTFLIIISYYRIPSKEPRYLFNLMLPLAYFSYVALSKIKYRNILFLAVLLSNIIILLLYNAFSPQYSQSLYKTVISKLDNCVAMSNVWVPLNYFGKDSIASPREELVKGSIDEGYRIVLYKYTSEPSYTFDNNFLGQFPTIYNTSMFIILGNTSICKNTTDYSEPYLKKIRDETVILTNRSLNIDSWHIFFSNEKRG